MRTASGLYDFQTAPAAAPGPGDTAVFDSTMRVLSGPKGGVNYDCYVPDPGVTVDNVQVVNYTGSIILNSPLKLSGAATGSALSLTDPSATICGYKRGVQTPATGTLTLDKTATFAWHGGNLADLAVNVTSAATTRVDSIGASRSMDGTAFNVDGLLDWDSGNVTVANPQSWSSIWINSGGKFTIEANATWGVAAGDPTTSFTVTNGNNGLVQLNSKGTARIVGDYATTGQTTLQAGTLDLGGAANQNNGLFELGNGNTVRVSGPNQVLNINHGWITGNGTVDGNLTLGATGGGAETPVINPGVVGVNNGIGTITVKQSFAILSDDTITHIRVGVGPNAGQNSMIAVATGYAAVKGNLAFEAVGNGDPAVRLHTLIDIQADPSNTGAKVSGQFNGLPEQAIVQIGGVKFNISYVGKGGPDPRDCVIAPTPGNVKGKAWRDRDRNGLQDAGEPVMPGVVVTLYDSDGNQVAQTTTDSDGIYQFADVPGGDYYEVFTDPDTTWYRFTIKDAGDDTLDSDADPASGQTAVFTVGGGADQDHVDAGFYRLASVSGRAWRDGENSPALPHNGLQDPGEGGLAGITVVLYDANGVELARTTTLTGGYYQFGPLEIGRYRIQFILPPPEPGGPYAFTTQHAGDPTLDSDPDAGGYTDLFDLGEGEDNTTIDAGILVPPADHQLGGP